MSRIEQLTKAATALSDDQLDGLIDYARYLSSEPFYYSATPEVIASIERGLGQHAAGDTADAAEIFARLQAKIDSARS